jgi:diguanylate cyclase (GGDEF)-like protein/PAS domain S-box-containing protein
MITAEYSGLKMKRFRYMLYWFKLGEASSPAARALLVEASRSLRKHISPLYAILTVNSVSIAYMLPADFPSTLRYCPLGVFLLIVCAHSVPWRRSGTSASTAEEALRRRSKTQILVVVLNIGALVWIIAALGNMDLNSRTPVLLLVFMGSVGSAYCLRSFPSAARLTLVMTALPIVLQLMISGDAILICTGINLSLFLILLVGVMNADYRRFAKLMAVRARMVADRDRISKAEALAREREAKVKEIAARFDTALNNMSQGLCFFDGAQRLIVCNRRYIDMYGLSPDGVHPGMSLRQIAETGFDADWCPDVTKEAFLGWIDRMAVIDQPAVTVVELKNGRVYEIRHQPMPDRGWVATHEDVTERYQTERALTAAKANAERAEREARIAHATLLNALDIIPEGLVIFDADDRYVLWNRRYAEIYAESRDFLKVGMRFEDTVRAGLERGLYPDAKDREEEWLRERLARHAEPQNSHEQQLSGDRWLRIEERRTADGGRIGMRVDITDLKGREASFRLLFEENPLPMWVVDINTLELLAVNAATCRHYGYSREQLLTMTVENLRVPEERDMLRNEFHNNRGMQSADKTRRHITADGKVIDVAIEARPLRYNERDACVAVAFDLTDRLQAERRIMHLACHDALTDLPNRTAFDEHFDFCLDRAERFAVMCIDLDRFKEINDLFGHAVGDAVLQEASRRFKAASPRAFLARVGGDEFIAIICEGPLPSSAESVANSLKESLSSDMEIDGHSVQLDLSIGIAVFPQDGCDARTLIGNADAALYRAKHEGRGAIRFFTATMDQQLRDRRALERHLRSAVERGELRLDYQPQARTSGEIIGFEALVRWQHPQRGLVMPEEFIPIAEESGLIVDVGEWVLRQACAQAACWCRPLQIAVNVSAAQFRRGNLQGVVHSILLETGLCPTRLELEITEGVLIENFSRATSMLRGLKALGVRIALDDFGMGYSSLSYLESFPLDRIKIDRTFVANLGHTDRSLSIIRAVIGLAHGLSVPVLGEGVETSDQLAILSREACDDVQGYLIGDPRPIEAYADVVGNELGRTRQATASA